VTHLQSTYSQPWLSVWVALSRQLGMQKFTTDEFKDVKGSFITELSNIGLDSNHHKLRFATHNRNLQRLWPLTSMESCEFYCCNISRLQSALLAGKCLVLWFNIFICWKCCNYNWLWECHSKNTRGLFLNQSELRESLWIDQWENRLKGKLLCIAFCVISIPIFARLVYLTTEVLDSMIQKLLEQAKESRKGWFKYFENCSNAWPL